MNRKGPVGEFCTELFTARAAGRLNVTRAEKLVRVLALTVAEEVALRSDFYPERDRSVLWAREVLTSALNGDAVPRASLGLEAVMEFAREDVGQWLSGKELAAGERSAEWGVRSAEFGEVRSAEWGVRSGEIERVGGGL